MVVALIPIYPDRQKYETKIVSRLGLPLVLHLSAKNCCVVKLDGSTQPNK